MPSVVLLCTDGSDLAVQALAAGFGVLAAADRTVVATVTEPFDLSLVTGVSGFGGGIMTAEQHDDEVAARAAAAREAVQSTTAALGLDGAETLVVEGDPGPALCDLAATLRASVLVAGTHGRGGLRRALLGSVSDHLVRNAPCPVLVTRPEHG
jgi:nucleotide-binding universal stress UspA family protein